MAIKLALAGALGALASFAPVMAQAPAQDAPRDVRDGAALLAAAPAATLASGDLKVTVALPDAAAGFYRGTRFDWSGMITSVTLGGHAFYGLWFDGVAANVHDYVDDGTRVIAGPRTAAAGPAEEFVSRMGESVPGYDEAAPGGTFIKIGVGRLRRDDAQPYDHFAGYTIVDGGAWTVRREPDRIVFTQRLAPDASGYGYEYEKTVSVAPGGTMTIAHRLRNIGTRRIATEVYNHNFARFDGAEIGTGITVRFPFAIQGPVNAPELASVSGDTLRYLKPLAPGEKVQLPAQTGAPGAFAVTGANGASITFAPDAPLVRTVLWSVRRTAAVEPFIAVDVAPGAEQRWSWRYTYAAPATK